MITANGKSDRGSGDLFRDRIFEPGPANGQMAELCEIFGCYITVRPDLQNSDFEFRSRTIDTGGYRDSRGRAGDHEW